MGINGKYYERATSQYLASGIDHHGVDVEVDPSPQLVMST